MKQRRHTAPSVAALLAATLGAVFIVTLWWLDNTPFDRRVAASLTVALYVGLLCATLIKHNNRLETNSSVLSSQDDNSLLIRAYDYIVTYASETGTAKQIAELTSTRLQQLDFHTKVLELNQLVACQAAPKQGLLMVLSTTGEGDAPRNGAKLMQHKQLPLPITAIRYGILALGDSRYTHFCGFALQTENWLNRGGAKALFPTILVNQGAPDAISSWFQNLDIKEGPSESQQWTLQSRTHLNPDSKYPPLYRLSLQSDTPADWKAGDLVRLRPKQGEGNRLYSIASTPEQGQLTLFVRLMSHPDGSPGLGSGLLCQQLAPGEPVQLDLVPHPSFRLAVADSPLILIGAGSGAAGLLAHLDEQLQQGNSGHWLIFGERCPLHDNYLPEQIQPWLNNGHLKHFDAAYSRDPHSPTYVQDYLTRHADRLHEWVNNGASLLICGNRDKMGAAVLSTLNTLLSPETTSSLISKGRLMTDLY